VKCDSYTWIDGNTYTASNNTATYTLSNSVGCDSILNLNLVINESSTGTDTQFATESFTWIDGVTYTESNSTATYTLTNSNNCDSIITLDLVINNSSNIDVFDNQYEIELYPNPTNNDIIINLDGIDIVDAVILDIRGKVIKHELNLNDLDHINLSDFKAGTYFLKILSAKGIRKVCFIKN